jgi:hypothetical protein
MNSAVRGNKLALNLESPLSFRYPQFLDQSEQGPTNGGQAMPDNLPIPAEFWHRIPPEIRDLLLAAFAKRDAKIADLTAARNNRPESAGCFASLPPSTMTTFVYDGKRRSVRAHDDSRTLSITSYDVNGNVISETEPTSGGPTKPNDSGETDKNGPDEPFIAGK